MMNSLHAPNQATFSRRREAYILVVILGFAAVATSLGLAFLDSNSTVMPEAVNYVGSIRAGYLAGSGIATAAHYIMYPPTSVAYNQYFTGMSGVSPGGNTDYFNVSVQRSDAWSPPQSDPNLYRITALGVATDGNGAVRAKKTIVAEVQAPITGKWNIPYAALCRGNSSFPAIAKIFGDAHANGSLSGTGWCQGKLSGVVLCSWLGTGPPASITSAAATVTPIPAASTAVYSSYTIKGKTYTAYTGFTSNTMTATDAANLNAIDMSANNPGRIILAPTGNFRVRGGVSLNGTLVVAGQIQFDDASTIRLSAVQDFPAVVATTDIFMLSDDCNVNITGPVILGGRVNFNNRDRCTISITGPTIFQLSTSNTKTADVLNYTYSATRAVFWNLENPITPAPITVLSWKEN